MKRSNCCIFIAALALALTNCGHGRLATASRTGVRECMALDASKVPPMATPAIGEIGLAFPCAPVQNPAAPYSKYEAAWAALTFDGADLPFQGLYAYFWVDRYLYEKCAITSTVAGFFLRDGGVLDNDFGSAFFSGYPIEYLDPSGFDMRVYPFVRATAESLGTGLYRMEATGADFHGVFTIQCRSVYFWARDYFSCYDAQVTDAAVDFRGTHYEFTGVGAFERWWGRGGFDPMADNVQGWWLYSIMHWDDGLGGQVHTLMWPRDYTGSAQPVFSIAGEISEGGATQQIVDGAVNFNFPENDNADGWMRKYELTATLADGRQLQYTAQGVKEYRDPHMGAWQTPGTADDREAHDSAEGSMAFDGRFFTGRGFHEWWLTEGNPLPQ